MTIQCIYQYHAHSTPFYQYVKVARTVLLLVNTSNSLQQLEIFHYVAVVVNIRFSPCLPSCAQAFLLVPSLTGRIFDIPVQLAFHILSFHARLADAFSIVHRCSWILVFPACNHTHCHMRWETSSSKLNDRLEKPITVVLLVLLREGHFVRITGESAAIYGLSFFNSKLCRKFACSRPAAE